jgi:phenylacetate-CoA ligase
MRHLITLFYARLVELYRKPLMLSDATIKLIYIPGFNKLRAYNAMARAYLEFTKAKRNVPAYKAFLKSQGFSKPTFSGMLPNIHEIPYTDKENYVKKYSMDERCVNGKVPDNGVVIDESSGSSGTATNWARGKVERKNNAKIIKFGMRMMFGYEPLFVINAFALGPWATGVNVTMSCVIFSKLKSLGPDKLKIENTIKHFGKGHNYVIMGYPPFLKMLVDNSEIDWKAHNVSFIFGGESMSEGMRDYLVEKGIKRVYSSIGASDLELNFCSENDFTISFRRLLRSNAQLRDRIVKHTGALPMVFQFNPADFLIESSATGELIVTICRPGYIAPKIRYNIHDRGHILQMKELYSILNDLNIDYKHLIKPVTDLPMLLHYGRADMTVSFFGANISPVDVQEALYNLPALANMINSFCLAAVEDNDGNKQLIVSMELQQTKTTAAIDTDSFQADFFKQLTITNQDFREAKKMVTGAGQTQIQFYEFGQGPFINNDIRIKARYINS